MARQVHIIFPGLPHHVVHLGKLRAQVFFSGDYRRLCLEMSGLSVARFGVEIWAYCLMGNHGRGA